jgi:hypothetical protein
MSASVRTGSEMLQLYHGPGLKLLLYRTIRMPWLVGLTMVFLTVSR